MRVTSLDEQPTVRGGGPNDGAAGTTFACPLCGAGTERLFDVAGYWVRGCPQCTHQFAELSQQEGHVERVYGDEYFQGGGAGYPNYLDEEALLVERGRWYARRLAPCCKPGAVLDVGAAAGFTLHGLSQEGWEPFGVEPNAAMAGVASERFGYPVTTAQFETWEPGRLFDLVTMLQVIPHFIEPLQALAKSREILSSSGHLLIETWNRDSWTARLFGRHWHEYSPPSVLHWFTKRSLVQALQGLGFELVASGRPSKWINVAHAKSLLRSKESASLAKRCALGLAAFVPDRVSVPYPAEDLFWALFRRA